jgi:hypothetical protein
LAVDAFDAEFTTRKHPAPSRQLNLPVFQHAHRTHDERLRRIRVRFWRAKHGGEERHRLYRLAQTHVVGEHAALAAGPKSVQKPNPVALVLTQVAVERRGDVKAVRCGAGCVGGGGVFRERVRVVGLSGSELFVPFELRGAEDEVAGFLRRLDRAELAGASRDGREGVAAADGYLRSMRGERGSEEVERRRGGKYK